MPTLAHASAVPVAPPGEDDLPCDDGMPLETERHYWQIGVLIDSLDLAWRGRNDFFVGGNMFVYFSERQVKNNDFRGPDVFVVLDTVKRERKSWVVWGEEGRTPDVVIELLSESTESVDRGEKMDVYARALHVGDYFLYDPMDYRLEGYRLDATTRRYVRMAPDERGDFPVERMGLKLGVRPTRRNKIDAPMLRWLDRNGDVLPHAEEWAEREAQRAEQEARRAEQEAARAVTAERRVAELEARLRARGG
jgi:Uma2 family endonuclease